MGTFWMITFGGGWHTAVPGRGGKGQLSNHSSEAALENTRGFGSSNISMRSTGIQLVTRKNKLNDVQLATILILLRQVLFKHVDHVLFPFVMHTFLIQEVSCIFTEVKMTSLKLLNTSQWSNCRFVAWVQKRVLTSS